jgi:hypothetical protein
MFRVIDLLPATDKATTTTWGVVNNQGETLAE